MKMYVKFTFQMIFLVGMSVFHHTCMTLKLLKVYLNIPGRQWSSTSWHQVLVSESKNELKNDDHKHLIVKSREKPNRYIKKKYGDCDYAKNDFEAKSQEFTRVSGVIFLRCQSNPSVTCTPVSLFPQVGLLLKLGASCESETAFCIYVPG